jgi:hypothetical protein
MNIQQTVLGESVLVQDCFRCLMPQQNSTNQTVAQAVRVGLCWSAWRFFVHSEI